MAKSKSPAQSTSPPAQSQSSSPPEPPAHIRFGGGFSGSTRSSGGSSLPVVGKGEGSQDVPDEPSGPEAQGSLSRVRRGV